MIYLVRHGQTEWNLENRMQGHQDSPLSAEGRLQAEKLHERLKTVDFAKVYSSTSPTAIITAEIISAKSPENIVLLDGLREINMGLWEGRQVNDIVTEYAQEFYNFFSLPHLYTPTAGGETYAKLRERAVSAFEDILSEGVHYDAQGSHVLVVAHRMTLRTLMNHYVGNDLEEMGAAPDIPPASLSIIAFRDGRAKVELFGDISHYFDS
ncbi:histidine phosphatase family protein [Paenibacillus sp. VMFN-D1]|uniref:histidine phosphatase family protein n=1 Tax=Paenibacillus sp. VMFN-D1 TaxID=2135608 RepID=UPI000E387C1B|nr:histidine phosphatase family protein [Paenibacillus sp. VMFN-D1]RED37415.1 putative phosphoglycerate mutase [Paenibacillus sp. VMFN-D1]